MLYADAERPPEAAVPGVLLSTTMLPADAAADAPRWAAAGFRGFLFTGFQPDALTDLGEEPEEAQIASAGAAAIHLLYAKLDQNFLVFPLAPEMPFFADDTLAADTVRHIGHATRFAMRTGMAGIAIETCSESLFHDYQWSGYDWKTTPPDELARRAKAFGRDAALAAAHAYPRAQLLLIADSLEMASPLWFRLFEGVVAGAREAGLDGPHLLLRANAELASHQELHAFSNRAQRLLTNTLPGKSQEYWLHAGSIGLCLQPFDMAKADALIPRLPIESFRVQRLAARLFSGRYAWVESPALPWWAPPEEQAEPENGGTPKPADGLTPYTVGTPIDTAVRAGAFTYQDAPAYALRGEKGASVVFWNGLGESIQVEQATEMFTAIDIATGAPVKLEAADGSMKAAPVSNAVLANGLPFREWGLPYTLWADCDGAVRSSMPVSFGVANRAPVALNGLLNATVKDYGGIEPESQPITLEPSQDFEAAGVFSSTIRPGGSVRLGFHLALASGGSASRAFTFPTYPAPRWRTALNTPVAGSLLLHDLNGDGSQEIVACTCDGEVACLDCDGKLLWRVWLPVRFSYGPVACPLYPQGVLVAVQDQDGIVHAFTPTGRLSWELDMERAQPSAPMLSGDLTGDPNNELVAAFDNGAVLAIGADGKQAWRYESGGTQPRTALADISGDGRPEVFIICAGGAPAQCLTRSGALLWRTQARVKTSCVPLAQDVDGDGWMDLAIGKPDGGIEIRDALLGRIKLQAVLEPPEPIRSLTAAPSAHAPGYELIVSGASAITCLTPRLELVWQTPLACSAAPVTVSTKTVAGLLVSTMDGQFILLDASGRRLWSTPPEGGPLLPPPAILDNEGAGPPEWLAAFPHFTLQAAPLE